MCYLCPGAHIWILHTSVRGVEEVGGGTWKNVLGDECCGRMLLKRFGKHHDHTIQRHNCIL